MKYKKSNKRVTLKSISEILGLSISTVSKALNNRPDISDSTKEKVKELSIKLGYRPNLMARSLVKNKSNIIGVIIPDLNISYYSNLVQFIYENAQAKGYESIVMFHHEDPNKEKRNLEFLVSLPVDGLLVSITNGNKNRELLQEIKNSGIPLILYDRKPKDTGFCTISVNDYFETEALINSFLENNRRKIGYIGVTQGDDVTVFRYRAYREILRKNGIDLKSEWIINSTWDFKYAETKMKEALCNGVDLDALICAGGFIAYGAGKAILEMGYKMPEDIIIGEYGNNNLVQRLGVSFFSIDHSPEIIATRAVDLLSKYLEGKSKEIECKNILIPSKLIYYDHIKHEEKLLRVIK